MKGKGIKFLEKKNDCHYDILQRNIVERFKKDSIYGIMEKSIDILISTQIQRVLSVQLIVDSIH